MSFTCRDCGDQTCAHQGSHDAACEEWTSAVVADEEVRVPSPATILSCDCHADHELRLCTLEDIVARLKREMNRETEL